jgi:serine/threonine protein kinase
LYENGAFKGRRIPAQTRDINPPRLSTSQHIIPLGGIVVNEQNNVEGMLLEYIRHAITLRDFDGRLCDDQRARLWVSQFQSALEYLHSQGMVWGDAKPDNILVREDGDLVLVDFAGGATDGWVDWKVMDTLDGDLQASRRIEEFILGKAKDSESRFSKR